MIYWRPWRLFFTSCSCEYHSSCEYLSARYRRALHFSFRYVVWSMYFYAVSYMECSPTAGSSREPANQSCLQLRRILKGSGGVFIHFLRRGLRHAHSRALSIFRPLSEPDRGQEHPRRTNTSAAVWEIGKCVHVCCWISPRGGERFCFALPGHLSRKP